MKKLIVALVILSMLLSASPAPVLTIGADKNDIITEDFESGLSWGYTGKGSSEETVIVSKETAAGGKKSLLIIDENEESVGIASEKLEIEGGETYTLIFDILNVEGTGIKAYLRYSSPSNNMVYNKSIGTSKTGSWQQSALTAKAEDEVTHAQIFVMGGSKTVGKAYVDNIRLVKGTVKSDAITPSVPYTPKAEDAGPKTNATDSAATINTNFPEWTKIESIGNLETAEIKRSEYENGNLSGHKVLITNMAYGRENMKTFTVMSEGTAANGNDFTKNPQKAEIVDVDGQKVFYADYPVSGTPYTIYMPTVVFDDVYTKDLNYKFRFKAKRGKGVVSGADNFNFYVRQLDEKGARNGQTNALLIEQTSDWKQYEVIVPSTAVKETSASISGLFDSQSTQGFRDLYLKDIEIYVKDNSKPMLSFDMPSFIPEKGMHPRVFFTKNDISKIKENALHPDNKIAYELLLKEIATEETGIMKASSGDNVNEKSLGIIYSKAFYYAVWNDEVKGKEAIAALKNVLNTSNTAEYNTQGLLVYTVGALYDWCYPLLSEDDKKFFQDKGVDAAKGMEIGYPPTGGSTVYGHSSEAQLMRDQMAFAIAVSDEREDIYQNIAGRFFSEMKKSREFLYQAYSNSQGSSYAPTRFQWEMFSTYMMKALGMPDYYGPEQQKQLYWMLYARRPDGSTLRDGDTTINNNAPGTYAASGTRAFWLAGNYFKDPYLKGEALRRSKGGVVPTSVTGNQSIGAVDFILFNDPEVCYKTVREFPLSMYYPAPKGGMIARTSWAEGMNSPAVVAEMEIDEWWFQNHQHLDAGAFQIYYKGALANDTGYYQAGRDGAKNQNEGNTVSGTVHFYNYQRRTIAHNCMLVFDPNESKSNYNGQSNDGGQLVHNSERAQTSIDGFFENEDKYHVAKVLGQEIGEDTIQPDYTYLKGDLEKAYGEKVTGYERSFMFLNLKNSDHPAAMLVFDRVVSKDKGFDKKWVLHGLNEPEISGSRTVFTDTREGYNGKLTVDTLLPKSDNLKINVVGGEGREYMVDGVNYWAQTLKNGANEGGGYRIEVSPKNDSNEDYFLNVLQVGDANSEKTLETEMIEAATHVGAKIYDRVVLFGKGRDRVNSSISFNVSGEGTFKYTIADLKEGTWQVKKDGNPLSEIVATKDGGVGSFEAAAGSFELTYLGAYGEKKFTKTPLYSEGINIKVDSKYIYCDVEPTLINSRTMVPLRAIFEALDANVSWDEATATATGVSKDGATTVKITENSNVGLVNGNEVYLDSPAVIKNGRFLVPVRFISESLGAKVEWDDCSQTVYITPASTLASGSGGTAVKVVNATQSGDNGVGGSIELSYDGDISTGWSVQNTETELSWGVYELSEETEIKEIEVAFNKGNQRKYKFSIAVSSDGVNYTEVLTDAANSVKTSELELYKITNPVKGKYIKYIGKGSDTNLWNNVMEIVFYK